MAKKKQTSTYQRRRAKRKPTRRTPDIKTFIASVVAAILIFTAWKLMAADEGQPIDDCTDLTAVTITDSDIDSDIYRYEGFTVSYNRNLHLPNYVVWELTADETYGDVKRPSKFTVDPAVDGSATPDDYRNSGFDRGHMAPAADMKWSEEAMTASHYMTNIAPQRHTLNAGSWSTLENNCRAWARRDSVIVIVCGPVLTDRLTETIGDSHVVVPERYFKVVLAPYARPPRGIGFVMPNGDVPGGVQTTAMSIDDVEAITGLDFFTNLPDSIEAAVESQNRYQIWQRKKR